LQSGRLHDQSGSDAASADTYTLDQAVFPHMSNGLQVRVPDPLGLVVGMADIVAYLRSLSAELTLAAHWGAFLSDFEYVNDSRFSIGLTPSRTGESLI
jgi:hypothetical protein